MCLRKITKTHRDNDKTEIWYKVVVIQPKSLIRNMHGFGKVYKSMYRNDYFNMHTWCENDKSTITAQEFIRSGELVKPMYYDQKLQRSMAPEYKMYKNGYHFYDRKAAMKLVNEQEQKAKATTWMRNKKYVVVECAVNNIRTRGTDAYGKACVAEKFMILREIKQQGE